SQCAVRADSALCQSSRQLRTGELLSIFERLCQYCSTAAQNRGIQTELAIVMSKQRFHSWSGKREHPSNVSRRDEMPRRAEQVRTKNRAVADFLFHSCVGSAAGALGNAPLCHCIVLRLHRAE